MSHSTRRAAVGGAAHGPWLRWARALPWLCLLFASGPNRALPVQVRPPLPQHGHQDPVHGALPPGRGPSLTAAAALPPDLPSADPHPGAGPPEPGQPCPLPDRDHQVSSPVPGLPFGSLRNQPCSAACPRRRGPDVHMGGNLLRASGPDCLNRPQENCHRQGVPT